MTVVKASSEKALPEMKFERTSQVKSQDQLHRVRITLSSKNVRNLEKGKSISFFFFFFFFYNDA